jgi:hypothetical protein
LATGYQAFDACFRRRATAWGLSAGGLPGWRDLHPSAYGHAAGEVVRARAITAMVLRSRLQNHVEGRLRRAPDALEAARRDYLANPCLAGLRRAPHRPPATARSARRPSSSLAHYSSQLLLQDAVGRQPDRITHALGFWGTRRSLGWQRPHHRENRNASRCPGSVVTTGASTTRQAPSTPGRSVRNGCSLPVIRSPHSRLTAGIPRCAEISNPAQHRDADGNKRIHKFEQQTGTALLFIYSGRV